MATISFTRSLVRSSVGVLILGAAITATTADAATTRTTYRTATSSCVGPLPQFDANLRKSPIGIKNDGTTNAFISCSMPADFLGDMTTGLVEVHFWNFGDSNATVNCTLVAGNRFGGFGAVAGSVVATPATNVYVSWSAIDKHHAWGSNNFSCILPPGVEMNTIINQNNDTGNGL